MDSRWSKTWRFGAALTAVVVICGASVKGMPLVRHWWESHHPHESQEYVVRERTGPRVALVPNHPDALRVPADVARSLEISTTVAQGAPARQPLNLDGSLYLDANRLVHVHSRFAGEVVELGRIPCGEGTSESPEPDHNLRTDRSRQVRYGDSVRKGQLLAVLWSKDLGEKKSELVEFLSRLRLDKEKLKRLEDLFSKGSVPEKSVRDAERDVEADLIAASRAERTLRSWKLSQTEIESIRGEADDIRHRDGRWSKEQADSWARVEVTAPMDGTIVEKNIAAGDFIGSDLDIFKIADLSKLDVLAHAYEEELPVLERLPRDKRTWTVTLKADPESHPLRGSFNRIGNIIDPTQHTALVMGWVDNASGLLRVGQFVTARIELPVAGNEVAVPSAALVDQEGQSYVFVQDATDASLFTRRRVHPVRRLDEIVCLGCESKAGVRTLCPLHPGERVVLKGGVELAAELEALKAAIPDQVSEAESKTTSVPAAELPTADLERRESP